MRIKNTIYQIFEICLIFAQNCSIGIAVCICQRKCPERKHPVCGSDGVAYENHCELHREACIQGMIEIVNDDSNQFDILSNASYLCKLCK